MTIHLDQHTALPAVEAAAAALSLLMSLRSSNCLAFLMPCIRRCTSDGAAHTQFFGSVLQHIKPVYLVQQQQLMMGRHRPLPANTTGCLQLLYKRYS